MSAAGMVMVGFNINARYGLNKPISPVHSTPGITFIKIQLPGFYNRISILINTPVWAQFTPKLSFLPRIKSRREF